MDFSFLLKSAVLGISPDQAQRQSAEKSLINMLYQDTTSFYINCLQILSNEEQESSLRQAAGTLFKRGLVLQGNDNQILWDKVEQNIKLQIKQSLLATLITKVPQARRASADVISTICAIDLPRKQWPEIIQILAQNSNHQDLQIKQASIMTLGFICEQLKSSNQAHNLENDKIESILMGILYGMQKTEQDEEIKCQAIKALHDSLSFMQNHFQLQEVRLYVLDLLLDCLTKSKKIQISCLQCLIDFTKFHYDKFDDNLLNAFFLQIGALINNDDEEISIPAIEIFITIANEDKERMENTQMISNKQNLQPLNLMGKIGIQLLEPLLKNLTNRAQEDDDEEEDELSVKQSSYRCLSSIAEVVGDGCLPYFTKFIEMTIGSNEWLQRQAAVIVFGAMMEGPSKEKIIPMIMSSIITVVNLMKDQKQQVRVQTSLTLCKIADSHPESILQHQNLNEMMNIFEESFQEKPAIVKNICFLFAHLCEFQIENSLNNQFMQFIPNILNHMIKIGFRKDIEKDQLSVIDCSYCSILNIIQCLKNNEISSHYLKIFIEQLKQSVFEPKEKQLSLQTGILSGMHVCLINIDRITDSDAEIIYQIVIDHFKYINDISSDGIYVISALVLVTKKSFIKHLDQYYSYLKSALSKQNEPETFKAAIGSLADLSRALDNEMNKYMGEIIPALLLSLKTPEFNNECKLQAFLCLGDISLSCTQEFGKYLNSIIQLYDMGFVAAIQLSLAKDQGSLDYAEQLKEKLIESYTCIVHAFSEELHLKQQLQSHIPKVIEFMQKTCNSQLNPTIEYLRNCLNLISDIANFYGSKLSHLIKTPFTQDLINNIHKFIHIKENKISISYAVNVIQKI